MGIDASYYKTKKDTETDGITYNLKIHPLVLLMTIGMICITVIAVSGSLSGCV